MRASKGMAFIAVLALGTSAAATAGDGGSRVVELDPPAGPESGEPFLVADGDAAYMSWFEEKGSGAHALRLSRWDGERWDAPRTIVEGDDLFVNWADFPSILPLPDGSLVAHWPARSGSGTYSYDVLVSISRDAGRSWKEPVRPHRDATPTEHGFVSLVPFGSGGFDAVWLDGRKFEDGSHGDATREMALLHARYRDGGFEAERILDPRVCDCCQTGAAPIPGGMIVVYRDRSEVEVRDISYVRQVDGRWSEPRVLHADGWEIPACPVNGPAVASSGNEVAVAWYTAPPGRDPGAAARATPLPSKEARVLVAFSADGATTFGEPVQVDRGRPDGRVDVEMARDGGAFVSWVEETGAREAEVRVRHVSPGGRLGTPITIARIDGSRASGFPRMVRSGRDLLFAWTDAGESPRVRVARVAAPEGDR